MRHNTSSERVGHGVGDHNINHLSDQARMPGKIHDTIVFSARAELCAVAG